MILIVATTNRKQSKTYQIALYYQQLFQNLGKTSQILSLENLPSDFAFSALYENMGKNPAFNEHKATMDKAEKFVFIVPEYNGSFPGVLKTFIDGLGWPNALKGKKAALVGIGDGAMGGAHALSHLTDIFHYLGCNVLSLLVRISQLKKNFTNGKINDVLMEQLLKEQAEKLILF